MLTKYDNSMNPVVFDKNDLSFIMTAEKIQKTYSFKEYHSQFLNINEHVILKYYYFNLLLHVKIVKR